MSIRKSQRGALFACCVPERNSETLIHKSYVFDVCSRSASDVKFQYAGIEWFGYFFFQLENFSVRRSVP